MNWIITDEGSTINVTHLGDQVFNSPKSDTQIKAVPALTGDNTTNVDKLYIGNDNSYPCQIPYNDVTVDGDTPSDLDDFENKVSAILNNVSSSSYITVDFLTLSQKIVDSEVIDGQVYKYVDAGFLPASIDHILLTGSGTQTYNNIGQAYVTAIGKYVQCDYDLASNTIVCVLEQEFLIIDDGVTFSVTPLKDDFVGVTYVLALPGSVLPYEIQASSNIWDSAKTKVVGFVGLDENGEPLLSYGSYTSLNKVQVHVMNVFGQIESDPGKQHSITAKVITTL